MNNRIFKNAILLSCLGVACVNTALAGDKMWNVKANPAALAIGVYNAEVHYNLDKALAIGPSLSFFNYDFFGTNTSGFGLNVRANYFLNGDSSKNGWYAGGALGYSSVTMSNSYGEGNLGGVNIGGAFGYQWLWDSGFNLDLGGGVQYAIMDSTIDIGGQSVAVGGSGVSPFGELTLGYMF